MAAVDPEIEARLEDPDKFGGILTVGNFILKRLRDTGLIVDREIPPSRLGVHPANRGSYGINVESVHGLGLDITQIGWSWPMLGADPLAVQDDPSDGYIQEHNAKLSASTDKLAPCPPASIEAGTLTNGHTTLFLKALEAGVPCDIPQLSIDGHMSLASIVAKDPELGKAVTNGWKWSVLHFTTRRLYGDRLFELLSDMRNASVSRSESEVQVLVKVYRLAAASQARGVSIPWDDIYRTIVRTKPPCIDYVHCLVTFVKLYGNFVPDLAAFHAKFVPNDRSIPGSFYQKINDLVIKVSGVEHKVPFFLTAILKAEYSCPPSFVLNKQCAFIPKGLIDGFGRKRANIAIAAETVLSKARELINKHSISDEASTRLLGHLDVAMARFALEKQKGLKIEHKSVEEVGNAFWIELEATVGAGCTLNPWPQPDTGKQSQSSASSTGAQKSLQQQGPDAMQMYTTLGKHIPMDNTEYLKQFNYTEGCTVVLKKARDEKCTIKSIASDVVVTHANGEDTTYHLEQFMSSFTTFVEEQYPCTEQYQGKGNGVYLTQGVRGFVFFVLATISRENALPQVAMYKKPKQKVIATEDYAPGKLVLVPETTGVIVAALGDKLPSNAVDLGCLSEHRPDDRFFLTQPSLTTEGKPSLNPPFWLVRRVSGDADAKNVNMVVDKIAATCPCAMKKFTVTEKTVKIPVLKNSTHIKKGDELVVKGDELVVWGAGADKEGHEAEPVDEPNPKAGKGRKRAAPKPVSASKPKAKAKAGPKAKSKSK